MISTIKLTSLPRFVQILLAALFLLNSPSVISQVEPNIPVEEQETPAEEYPEDDLGRNTPRGTVNGFIKAVAETNYERASHYLNLDPTLSAEEKERLVMVFQELLDRGGNITHFSLISNDSIGRPDDRLPTGVDRVGTVRSDGENIELLVEKTEGTEGGPIWLFSRETVESIADTTPEGIALVESITPDFLQDNLWKGVPVGQWIAILLIALLAYLVSWAIISAILFLIPWLWKKARTEPTSGVITALGLPFRMYFAVWLFVVLSEEIAISIILRQRFSGITMIIGLVALVIFLWSLTDFISKFSRRRMSLRGNVSGVSVILFLRRAAKTGIGIFGVIAVLSVLGFNVTTGLAALGIGGIAIALGAQKTVENFVGSVTLITDQPVRIGDYCKVGDIQGVVEQIGMRSTKIRTDERTIVTIPNRDFASEKIENYAHRDKFLFSTVLAMRYETTPDQVRYLLVEIRKILYAHPKVNPDPARIRFLGLGASSLDLEVWTFINAVDFNEYLEVKEDLLLRIMDVVAVSGTDFAFPSQTLYFSRDKGVSEEKTKEAEERVRKWKENNDLQIPDFDPERIKELKNTIPYPGSVNPKGTE